MDLQERRKDQREYLEEKIEDLKKESDVLWHLHFRVSESSIWDPVKMIFPSGDRLKSEELEIPYLIKKKWESILYDEANKLSRTKYEAIADLENKSIIFYAKTEDNSTLEVISDKRTDSLEIEIDIDNVERVFVNADQISNLVFVLQEWLNNRKLT